MSSWPSCTPFSLIPTLSCSRSHWHGTFQCTPRSALHLGMGRIVDFENTRVSEYLLFHIFEAWNGVCFLDVKTDFSHYLTLKIPGKSGFSKNRIPSLPPPPVFPPSPPPLPPSLECSPSPSIQNMRELTRGSQCGTWSAPPVMKVTSPKSCDLSSNLRQVQSPSWRQLYKNRSSRKIDSRRLFSRE